MEGTTSQADYVNQISLLLERSRVKGAFTLQQLNNVYLVLKYYTDGKTEGSDLTPEKAFAVVVDALEAGSKVGAFTFQEGAVAYNILLNLKETVEAKNKSNL